MTSKPRASVEMVEEKLTWAERISRSWDSTKEIVGKVLLVRHRRHRHRRVHSRLRPAKRADGHHGQSAWWSVPAAVLVGIPLYSNAAGIIPIVSALLDKGRVAWHGAGVHDVGGRLEPARSHHLAPRVQAATHRHLHRRDRGCRNYHYWLFIQYPDLEAFS
ncbi:MAG: hypothetical protein MZV65_35875 [Chromatiales bacterium]|nr:hypothetical protein [Chromatiales bacterium]